MPKKTRERSALEVSRLTKAGLHMVGGVAGLGLRVSQSGARSWILRVMVSGKRRDLGLGGYPDVTLAGAREAARKARALIRDGIDPVDEAKAKRSAMLANRASCITFSAAAEAYIAAMEPQWRNAKHAQQWRNTIATYANPTVGDVLVKDVDTPQVLAVLEPIWTTKTETARRLRGRIESILDWARVRGHRDGDNPARWRGHLDKLLPTLRNPARPNHHAALPYAQIGAFCAELRQQAGTAARALEYLILTACRSKEVRGARWDEIDFDAATWTIPAHRMKAAVEHRVPLSDAALAILRQSPESNRQGLIFPNVKGGVLSEMTLTALIRRMNQRREADGKPRWTDPKRRRDITAHGFRSTFRDWCAERTTFPNEVAEAALAHTIANRVESAYRRGDLFEKRRRLMADWARFIG